MIAPLGVQIRARLLAAGLVPALQPIPGEPDVDAAAAATLAAAGAGAGGAAKGGGPAPALGHKRPEAPEVSARFFSF